MSNFLYADDSARYKEAIRALMSASAYSRNPIFETAAEHIAKFVGHHQTTDVGVVIAIRSRLAKVSDLPKSLVFSLDGFSCEVLIYQDGNIEKLAGQGFTKRPFLYLVFESSAELSDKAARIAQGCCNEPLSTYKHFIDCELVAPLFIMRDMRSSLGANAMLWSESGGYNAHIDKAKRFTLEEAQAIHDSRRTDIPILLSCAEAISYPAIDVQHISKAESVSYAGDEYIIQRANMYNGNYIHYISQDAANDGQLYTDNYSKAQVYTLHQALSIAADGSGLVMWPKSYFDERVTKCAPISLIDNQAMGFDHGIKENKLEKVPA